MNLEDVSPSILRNPMRSEMKLGIIDWLSKTAQIPHLGGADTICETSAKWQAQCHYP